MIKIQKMEELKFPPFPSTDGGADWTYSMRRDMQEIVPGLYLGPFSAAVKDKCNILLQHHITYIVCIRQDVEANFIRPNFPDVFKYLVLNIADTVTENIIQYFPKVKQFLDECFSNGGNALVHGNAGISRSAALVIAYIMEKYGLSYKEAFLHVQHRRFCINPNEGFTRQLMEYEPIYRARLTLQNGHPSQVTGHLKRTIDEVESTEDEKELINDSAMDSLDIT